MVVGDRKLTLGESTGQIVDLAEEQIYDLDVKKKTYTVTTFAELKKRIEEQRAKAEKEATEAKKEAAKEDGRSRPRPWNSRSTSRRTRRARSGRSPDTRRDR